MLTTAPERHFQPLWRFNYRLDATNGTIHPSTSAGETLNNGVHQKMQRPIAELPHGVMLSTPQELLQHGLLSNHNFVDRTAHPYPVAGALSQTLPADQNITYPPTSGLATMPTNFNASLPTRETPRYSEGKKNVDELGAKSWWQRNHEAHWSAQSTAAACSENSDNDPSDDSATTKIAACTTLNPTTKAQNADEAYYQNDGGNRRTNSSTGNSLTNLVAPYSSQSLQSTINAGCDNDSHLTVTQQPAADIDSTEKTNDRYVILPGGMFARPKDVYVESLPGGVGRQTGGCLVMSLTDLLKRYDALDKHYFRLKQENAQLRTVLFEMYQRPQGTACCSSTIHSTDIDPQNAQQLSSEQGTWEPQRRSQKPQSITTDSHNSEGNQEHYVEVTEQSTACHKCLDKPCENVPPQRRGNECSHARDSLITPEATPGAETTESTTEEHEARSRPQRASRPSVQRRQSLSTTKSTVVSPVKAFIRGGYRNHGNLKSHENPTRSG